MPVRSFFANIIVPAYCSVTNAWICLSILRNPDPVSLDLLGSCLCSRSLLLCTMKSSKSRVWSSRYKINQTGAEIYHNVQLYYLLNYDALLTIPSYCDTSHVLHEGMGKLIPLCITRLPVLVLFIFRLLECTTPFITLASLIFVVQFGIKIFSDERALLLLRFSSGSLPFSRNVVQA